MAVTLSVALAATTWTQTLGTDHLGDFTPPTGAVGLVAGVAGENGPTFLSYGGVSMTQVGEVGDGLSILFELLDLSGVVNDDFLGSAQGTARQVVWAAWLLADVEVERIDSDTASGSVPGTTTVSLDPGSATCAAVANIQADRSGGVPTSDISAAGSGVSTLTENQQPSSFVGHASYKAGVSSTQAIGASVGGAVGHGTRVVGALYAEVIADVALEPDTAVLEFETPAGVDVLATGDVALFAVTAALEFETPPGVAVEDTAPMQVALEGLDVERHRTTTGGTEGQVLTYHDETEPTWEDASGGGVTDHGALTGLGDDDHPQYATDSDLSAHAAASDPHTGYILESLLDAKGDVIAASADNTPGRLPVGSNGQVLTADSAQTLGVKWASAGASLTVEEQDASPSVSSVDKLIFPNGTVTDLGSGDVSIAEVPTGAVICHAKRITSHFSLTQNAWTSIDFNGEVADTDGMHDNSTNPSRITAVKAGWYIAYASIEIGASASGGYRRVRFLKNGTDEVWQGAAENAGTTARANVVTSGPVYLAVGDYLQCQAYTTVASQSATYDDGSTDEHGSHFAVVMVGSGNIAGFAKEVIGTTAIGASFDNASRIIYKSVTLTKPGLITQVYAAAKGNGTNVGTIGVALYADNAGAPGNLLVVGAMSGYNGIVDIFKNTTAAWIGRPLNAWVEAGTYWLAVQTNYNSGAIQVAYDSSGPDYSQATSNQWFPDSSLAAGSAATRTYSIKADIIYGGQGERGYREATSFPVGAPAGTKVYRTDVRGGMLFRYDGTRWVSDQEFTVGSAINGATADASDYLALPADYDVYITAMDVMTWLSATAVWVVTLQSTPWDNSAFTTIGSQSTSGDTASRYYHRSAAINTVLATSGANSGTTPTSLFVFWDEQTGTASLWSAVNVRYRLIAT